MAQITVGSPKLWQPILESLSRSARELNLYGSKPIQEYLSGTLAFETRLSRGDLSQISSGIDGIFSIVLTPWCQKPLHGDRNLPSLLSLTESGQICSRELLGYKYSFKCMMPYACRFPCPDYRRLCLSYENVRGWWSRTQIHSLYPIVYGYRLTPGDAPATAAKSSTSDGSMKE